MLGNLSIAFCDPLWKFAYACYRGGTVIGQLFAEIQWYPGLVFLHLVNSPI